MRFNGFYGNDDAKAFLASMFDARRIPHAILIDGPQGAGKKTLARILSAAAVCERESGVLPCGECRQCKNALGGVHPDVHIFSGAGTRSFGVDAVRSIRSNAFVSPNDARRKVFILSDIDNMTEQAQNALLKILEEPPASVVFILTCVSRANLLETVRSRAILTSVGPVSQDNAVRAVCEQCKNVENSDAVSAARISGGIIGRAKLMLDAGFAEIKDFAAAFTKALCGADIYSFLSLSGKLEKDGGLFTSFLDVLPALLRDAIAVRGGCAATLSGLADEALVLSRKTTVKKLYKALLTSLESRRAADRYANLTLHLTALFSQLWLDIHD